MEMGPRTSYIKSQGSVICVFWSRELMTGRKFLGPYTSVKSPMCQFLPGPAQQPPPPPPISKLFCTGPPCRKIAGSNTRSTDYYAVLLTTTSRLHIGWQLFFLLSKFVKTDWCSIHYTYICMYIVQYEYRHVMLKLCKMCVVMYVKLQHSPSPSPSEKIQRAKMPYTYICMYNVQ